MIIKLTFIVFFAIFSATFIQAQPKFTITATGGYGMPLPDLKGDITDSVEREAEESYFMKSGYNFGLAGKYALGKNKNIRLTLGGTYNKFSLDDSYHHTNHVEIHSEISIITASLGGEYAFLPKDKTNPFLSLDLTGNFFSGETEVAVTADSTADHDELGTTSSKLKSASRFGIAVGGGVDVTFNKTFGAVFGFKYNLANLIGKEYSATSAVGEYNLNDKEETTNKAKNISYIQIYGGINIYFGHPKKTVKK
jgi:opacity protein-like surface antigen